MIWPRQPAQSVWYEHLITATSIILRQIVIQPIVVTLVGDENMRGGNEACVAMERACRNRNLIGTVGLPEEGRAALAAKTPLCLITRPVPFQAAILDQLEIFHMRAGR